MNTNTKINRTRNRKDAAGVGFCRTVLIFGCLVIIFPVLFVIMTSLKSSGEFYENIWGLPRSIAWENFEEAWATAKIGEYMANSIIIVIVVLIATLIIGAMAGYALSKLKIKYAELILMLILLGNMLPSEAVIMPEYIMTSKLGIMGSKFSLMLPYTAWGLPMTIFIFRNFFDTLSISLLEAAYLDGCTEFQAFSKIAVPLMLPAIATNAIMLFVSWWGELLWATIALSATRMKTLPIGLTNFASQFGSDWGPLCAAICIVMIPLIIVFCFTQKYFVQGLTGGAVKG